MMDRRDFLRRVLQASAAGLIVPPFLRHGSLLAPGAAWAAGAASGQAASAPFDGRALVWVNLSGGNDGLNTVVPFTDPRYRALRPTLALPASAVRPLNRSIGLHPSLAPLVPHYEAGRLAIIQGVGYPEMDLSHFRGTDIWMSGSSVDSVISTGWMARFLEESFPSFPEIVPPAPYALQQSFDHRLPLTGRRGQTGVIIDDPGWFYDLIGMTYPGDFTDELPATRGGQELGYLRRLDRQTREYAEAVQLAATGGTNETTYPETTLGNLLSVVARLIGGGLQTPVFIVAEYDFDTHANQAEIHAERLASVGGSIAAFWEDLTRQGLDDRVVVMTTSEFGRRPAENGSRGTDHGAAAPHFVLGRRVRGGIYGHPPQLDDLDENENVRVQHDYRDVFGTILQHHFGATADTVAAVFGSARTPIGFLRSQSPPVDPPGTGDEFTTQVFRPAPNPASASRTDLVRFRVQLAEPRQVEIELFDAAGRRADRVASGPAGVGDHVFSWSPRAIPAGVYLTRIRLDDRTEWRRLVVLP